MNHGLTEASETSPHSLASQLSEPHQQVARRVAAKLKLDAATQLDVLVDEVEAASPSEIIAALFELEILGVVKQLPGRNFVKVW